MVMRNCLRTISGKSHKQAIYPYTPYTFFCRGMHPPTSLFSLWSETAKTLSYVGGAGVLQKKTIHKSKCPREKSYCNRPTPLHRGPKMAQKSKKRDRKSGPEMSVNYGSKIHG